MIWERLYAAFAFIGLLCFTAPGQIPTAPISGSTRRLDFHAAASDPYADAVRKDALTSMGEIQSFFGAPYPDPIHFLLVDDRADFDAAVKK
jgi:hypothetical protein